MDIVVESERVVEIKAVDRLLSIHDAQMLTYLRRAIIRSGS
jgi:GxxExxY protein